MSDSFKILGEKVMNSGIYFHKKTLKMVEISWVENDTVTVWSYHCIRTGKGSLTFIPLTSFKKYFSYLGEV